MKAYLLAAGALLASGPALAQEVVGGDPNVTTGFSGIYIGAAGGYDVQPNDGGSRILFDRNLDGRFGDTVLTTGGADAFTPGFCGGGATSANAPDRTSANAPTLAAGTPCRPDRDSWGYYGRIGFDQQMGAVVIGVVGEFGKTEINDSVSGFSGTPANYVMYRDISWEAGIRARAGFTPNNSTLFYGTFGPGYARINRSFSSSQSVNTFTGRGKRNQFGIQGGGGIEQRIGNNFSIGLEYMYHQYRDDDYRVRVGGQAGTPFTNAANGGTASGTDIRRSDDKFRWHSMRATAAFRF